MVDLESRSFEDFYRSRYDELLRLAYVLCGDRCVAQDLVQETFVRTLNAWPKIGSIQYRDAWVRRVLINLGRSRWRRVRREVLAVSRVWEKVSLTPELPESDESFLVLVRGLPRKQLQCVAMVYLEDRSIEETAKSLGIEAATVRVHLYRARLTLARQVAHSGQTPASLRQRQETFNVRD